LCDKKPKRSSAETEKITWDGKDDFEKIGKGSMFINLLLNQLDQHKTEKYEKLVIL
jgi:hypothetical protein